jgi:hypothetical protein
MLPADAFANTVHYLDYNNLRFVSLHALKGGTLTQWLYIFEGDGPGDSRFVFEDLINSGIQKMQPEAFIVHKNHFIYIKNKSELKVLSL